jgi:hypothetical protein
MFSGTLQYAVRWPVLGKYLGQLAIVLAVLALPPLAAAAMDGDAATTLRYGLVLAALLGIGLPFARRPTPTPIQGNEALAIAALAFILGAFIMALPLMSPGLDWLDAMFESTSAISSLGGMAGARSPPAWNYMPCSCCAYYPARCSLSCCTMPKGHGRPISSVMPYSWRPRRKPRPVSPACRSANSTRPPSSR